MTIFRLVLFVASLALVASTYAQDKDKAAPETPRSAEKAADKPVETRHQVIEISRSPKPNCDIKPVMTDDEIARCKKARGR